MVVQDIKLAVHAHPTLSEVVDELFKAAKVNKYKNLDLQFSQSWEFPNLVYM